MPAKKVIITTGCPAGCGPFITLKAIEALKNKKIDFFVVGDKKILQEIPVYKKIKNRINLVDLNTPGIEKIKKGYSSKLAGSASLNYLKEGLEIAKEMRVKHFVTAPLSKEAVKLVFPQFCGHTEYLADYFKTKNFAMMMVSKKLKVVLFTRHIPLRKIPSFIRKKELTNNLFLVQSCLKEIFRIKHPKIAFASLNPHAGINTFLDKEDKIIYAAIKKFKEKIYGPFPSDTLFLGENLSKYDCLITTYHDQAMIPFKLLSFGDGVNLTLGLPIIRTSPAHGVAYDIIRQKKLPFSSSMEEAIKLALRLP